MTIENLTAEQIEARQRAHADLAGYRERLRIEREARSRQNETAEEEIAREVNARRDEEARRALVRAELQRCYALREANIAAERERERQAKLDADPRLQIAETPARRLAKQLRERLGDGFGDFMAELKTTTLQQFVIELRRIPDDERAEAINRQRAEEAIRRAGAALVVPKPLDAHEALILARHGLAPMPSSSPKPAQN